LSSICILKYCSTSFLLMSIYNKRERLRTRLEMEEGLNLMDYLEDKVTELRSQKALLYSNIFSSLGKKDYI
jgi:hypothetical protein